MLISALFLSLNATDDLAAMAPGNRAERKRRSVSNPNSSPGPAVTAVTVPPPYPPAASFQQPSLVAKTVSPPDPGSSYPPPQQQVPVVPSPPKPLAEEGSTPVAVERAEDREKSVSPPQPLSSVVAAPQQQTHQPGEPVKLLGSYLLETSQQGGETTVVPEGSVPLTVVSEGEGESSDDEIPHKRVEGSPELAAPIPLDDGGQVDPPLPPQARKSMSLKLDKKEQTEDDLIAGEIALIAGLEEMKNRQSGFITFSFLKLREIGRKVEEGISCAKILTEFPRSFSELTSRSVNLEELQRENAELEALNAKDNQAIEDQVRQIGQLNATIKSEKERVRLTSRDKTRYEQDLENQGTIDRLNAEIAKQNELIENFNDSVQIIQGLLQEERPKDDILLAVNQVLGRRLVEVTIADQVLHAAKKANKELKRINLKCAASRERNSNMIKIREAQLRQLKKLPSAPVITDVPPRSVMPQQQKYKSSECCSAM